jgi:hypothetical protein
VSKQRRRANILRPAGVVHFGPNRFRERLFTVGYLAVCAVALIDWLVAIGWAAPELANRLLLQSVQLLNELCCYHPQADDHNPEGYADFNGDPHRTSPISRLLARRLEQKPTCMQLHSFGHFFRYPHCAMHTASASQQRSWLM